jgi:hypothetical protein
MRDLIPSSVDQEIGNNGQPIQPAASPDQAMFEVMDDQSDGG